MTAPGRAGRPDPVQDAATLLARLTAAEAGIHEARFRQPAAVLEEIARLHATGETAAAIGARVGVAANVVCDRLHRAGVERRSVRRHRNPVEELERRATELIAAYESGATLRAVAADAGVCPRTLGAFLASRGVRLRHDRGWYRRRKDPLE
ncbi:MAG: hypothetical protein ABFC89_02700 [Methanospirillum sp.]